MDAVSEHELGGLLLLWAPVRIEEVRIAETPAIPQGCGRGDHEDLARLHGSCAKGSLGDDAGGRHPPKLTRIEGRGQASRFQKDVLEPSPVLQKAVLLGPRTTRQGTGESLGFIPPVRVAHELAEQARHAEGGRGNQAASGAVKDGDALVPVEPALGLQFAKTVRQRVSGRPMRRHFKAMFDHGPRQPCALHCPGSDLGNARGIAEGQPGLGDQPVCKGGPVRRLQAQVIDANLGDGALEDIGDDIQAPVSFFDQSARDFRRLGRDPDLIQRPVPPPHDLFEEGALAGMGGPIHPQDRVPAVAHGRPFWTKGHPEAVRVVEHLRDVLEPGDQPVGEGKQASVGGEDAVEPEDKTNDDLGDGRGDFTDQAGGRGGSQPEGWWAGPGVSSLTSLGLFDLLEVFGLELPGQFGNRPAQDQLEDSPCGQHADQEQDAEREFPPDPTVDAEGQVDHEADDRQQGDPDRPHKYALS